MGVICSPAINQERCRPVLKWAGGKTQLLPSLLSKVPADCRCYIEPFLGGGALFFALNPPKSVVADSNPELINLYTVISNHVETLIKCLARFSNDEHFFYEVRAQEWEQLPIIEAAARTLFLNKTCFNGLYRVNKKGQFNVPFGRYKNPNIVNEDALRMASQRLKKATVLCGNYAEVLQEFARKDDFVFLDPPYLPISESADFKRYTRVQFRESDHLDLVNEIDRLHKIGCHVILTSSNHPLMQEKYKEFPIDVVDSRRFISCNGKNRRGEDLVINIAPRRTQAKNVALTLEDKQTRLYPPTRFMGSKSKLLKNIWAAASQFQFDTLVDLFSGSGIVGYMMKSHGKKVISNDYMAMAATFSTAMIENSKVIFPPDDARALLEMIDVEDHFVENTFGGLYFSDDENRLIDVLRFKIKKIRNVYKRAIAMSALIRTCLKKRPRGIFTYVGTRYDDGRKDLRMTFHEQFLEAVDAINAAIFNNGTVCKARHGDAMTMRPPKNCLVYIDPPYYSRYSDNEYVRRYHFTEGLARDWIGVDIQEHTKTKKFKSYPTPFSTRKGAFDAFDQLFRRFRDNVLLVSYSSNCEPTHDEMISLLAKYKKKVDAHPIDYQYSFANQGHRINDNKNSVHEYLFVGY